MKLLFREKNRQAFGDAAPLFEWRPGGNNVAVGGVNGLVRIYTRYGEVIEEFSINDSVSTINWNKDGELLAITNAHSPTLVLYEFSMNNVQTMDISIGAKNTPTFVCWSPTEPLLLIGDNRGNMTLYNQRLAKKTPIMGKHQRAIRCGAFNEAGTLFALGSDDMSITVNNADGDTVHTFACSGELECLQITKYRRLDDNSDKPEDFLSVIVSRKSLMILKLNDPESPINLQFQEKYGNIITTSWFGNGYILVGFSLGYIVCLSAEKFSKVSQEVFSIQDYKNHLAYLTVNTVVGRVYSVGDNLLKIRDLYDLKELTDMVDIDADNGLTRVGVCDDGSLAAVSDTSGSFSIYLTKLPMLASAYQSSFGILSSLNEVSIYRDVETQPFHTLNVKFEPSLIAVGPFHVAVVNNHRAWYYQIRRTGSTLVYEHDYITTVTKLRLNAEWVAAQLDGKVMLHKLPKLSSGAFASNTDIQEADSSDCQTFPDSSSRSSSAEKMERIHDTDLSEKFFVYCTNTRYVYYYSLSNERVISDFKHSCEVHSLFVESEGIRMCFIDEHHDVFVYNPVDDLLTQIPAAASLVHCKCLWETFTIDRDSFVVYDVSSIRVFVIAKNVKGEQVLNQLATMPIPFGNMPLLLSKGIVFCNTQNGRINTMLLKSHKTETNLDGKSAEELQESLQQSVTLKRWRNAWRICDYMKDDDAWKVLARAALDDLNIDLAIRIFQSIGDVAMVWTLKGLLFIEDQLTLAGYVAALTGDFDAADELFTRSDCPIEAMEMQRDIQHWDRALELAQQFAPLEIPMISKEYAAHLELSEKHKEALRCYEEALAEFSKTQSHTRTGGSNTAEEEQEDEEFLNVCKSGMARMLLRTGDLQRGVQIAMEIPNRAVKKECGLILEGMKQFEEAGRLFESGEFYDRAVAAFLRCKNWIKVNELIGKVRSPKILCQYGKVLSAERRFERALEIYEKAKDYDSMTRVLLKNLNRPEEAIRLAQQSKSIEGAKMVAKFFTEHGNNESAIEFLVLSQCYQEAYELAENVDRMAVYANALEATGNAALFAQLAEYYSRRGTDPFMAGKFAGLAKNYSMALSNLIKASAGNISDDDPAAEYAVKFVTESDDKTLINKLIDFLMGETDGIPKNPKYLFQLYVQLQMYAEAAKTAVIIAQEQQSKGFYKAAHDLLFEMYKTLREQNIHVPMEMENNLQLLHSYNIIKGLIKRSENYIAARLLIRISTNISQFSMHASQILTSAVITCMKAGLKASAFRFASQLLQPNYRQRIDEKYRKKIETVVRKTSSDVKDIEERCTPCPFCSAPVPEFTLNCADCKTNIPYCIVTGQHVMLNDFATCPSCHFPALYSEFKKLISTHSECPMCCVNIDNIMPGDFSTYRRNS